jgi:hypothetical protein
MIQTEPALADLYLADETAWLEAMADRIRKGEFADLDYSHLQEYLTDMARRDRREVESRLAQLLLHILKWRHQAEHRSRSWQSSIIEQRHELSRHLGRGVLRNHAETVLDEMYREAVERAAIETGLAADSFPAECPYTVDELLAFECQ